MAALTLHTVTLAGVVSVDGATLGTQTWSFTTEPRPIVTTTLFGNTTPTAVASDTRAVEVGTHFTPTQSGQVTAIRFYKAAANTGVHTVSLWRTNGTRLSRVTVTGETASGWQTMQLPTPIQLTSGTPYVVSYTALTDESRLVRASSPPHHSSLVHFGPRGVRMGAIAYGDHRGLPELGRHRHQLLCRRGVPP